MPSFITEPDKTPSPRLTAPAFSDPQQKLSAESVDGALRESASHMSWFSLRGIPAWVMVVVAVIPFWLMPAAHMASDPETATGFFHEELPYYMANGRAALDRGNGILYPNAYDPDATSPAIYAHWLLWCLGLLPAIFGTDPGQLMLAATFFASLVFSATTWMLIRERSDNQQQPHAAFLFGMWGGGLLVAGGFLAGQPDFTTTDSTLLQFDPGRGLWFLNWGRNASFATEAVYHSLVAACWLSEIRHRPALGTMFCFLLATTHPWSGLELLLTLNLWRGVQLLKHRNRITISYAALSISMLVAFLYYYKIWLPQFSQHSKLQSVWELNWNLQTFSAILAYGAVGGFAVWRIATALLFGQAPLIVDDQTQLRKNTPEQHKDLLRSAISPLNHADHFLGCALLVAVGLAFHDRLIKPVQPLHFTRGYVWMPLFLLGLPVIQTSWERLNQSGLRGRLVVATCVVLLCTDNIAFAWIQANWQWTQTRGYHLNANDRALLADLNRRSPGAVILTESETLNYLSPAYANVRPWLGHPFNTPDFESRAASVKAAFIANQVDPQYLPTDVDVLVIHRSRETRTLESSSRWVALESQNAEWQLWGQANASVKTNVSTHATSDATAD